MPERDKRKDREMQGKTYHRIIETFVPFRRYGFSLLAISLVAVRDSSQHLTPNCVSTINFFNCLLTINHKFSTFCPFFLAGMY